MTEVQEKIKVFAVCGPTASGKTSLSVTLAKKLHAEVVSCDSMQIYRGMEIGTAKPTADEMQGVPHHLMGFQDPAEPCFQRDIAWRLWERWAETYMRVAKACCLSVARAYMRARF